MEGLFMIIRSCAVCFVELLIGYSFFRSYFRPRELSLGRRLLPILAAAALLALALQLKNLLAGAVSLGLLTALSMHAVFTGPPLKKLCFACFFCVLAVFAKGLSVLTLSLVWNVGFSAAAARAGSAILPAVVGRFVCFIFVKAICVLFPSKPFYTVGTGDFLLLTVPLFSVYSLCLMLGLSSRLAGGSFLHKNVLACGVGLLVSNMILFDVYEKNNMRHRLAQEARMLALEKQASELFIRQAEESSRELYRHLHDFKGELATALHLARSRKPEAVPLLEEIQGAANREFSALPAKNYGNSIVNAILDRARDQCGSNGIEFTASVQCGDLSFLDFMDASKLLDNALNNAMEGCMSVPEGKGRYVKIDIAPHPNSRQVLFSVENSKGRRLIQRGGRLLTTKADKRRHGFGMESIRETAEKYGGSMLFRDYGDKFSLIITIDMNKE